MKYAEWQLRNTGILLGPCYQPNYLMETEWMMLDPAEVAEKQNLHNKNDVHYI